MIAGIRSSQKGFIEIVIVFVLLLALWFIWPTQFHSPQQQTDFTSTTTSIKKGCEVYSGPPITVKGRSYWSERYSQLSDDVSDDPLDDNGSFVDTSSKEVDYQLRIKNVPVFMRYISSRKKTFDDDLTGAIYQNFINANNLQKVTVGGKEYLFLYPKSHGRLHSETGGSKFRPVKFGLIYLAHLDEKGKIVIIDGKDMNRGNNYVLIDVYQDPAAPSIPDKVIEECKTARPNQQTTVDLKGSPELIFPSQGKSQTQDQLQLEYFLFQRGSEKIEITGVWTIHCKPAIYLYPQKKQYINVKVLTKGELTYTDPKYPLLGWTTLASPDGSLLVDGKPFDYLYYESKIPDYLIKKPKEGFVVRFSELPSLFSTILPRLGLNEKQTKDFKEYWEKTLLQSPYYFVGIMDASNIHEIDPLIITPQPDTSIRVRLYFEALDKTISVTAPVLRTPENKGFTTVEWGGMIKTDKDHPFTCSQ